MALARFGALCSRTSLHLVQCHVSEVHCPLAVTERCVVGILERCQDTKDSLEFYFPWLKGTFNCGVHLNQQGKIGRLNATSEQICEIKRQNQLEYMIYDVAHWLLDAQLLVIDVRTSSSLILSLFL